jgi:hypothetical protein
MVLVRWAPLPCVSVHSLCLAVLLVTVCCVCCVQVLINYGSLNSSSIRDAYERDFYLLKNVIKHHDNVIECVTLPPVPYHPPSPPSVAALPLTQCTLRVMSRCCVL